MLSAARAADFAAGFTRGGWLEVADAGHNVQGDNPRDLIAALCAFWLKPGSCA